MTNRDPSTSNDADTNDTSTPDEPAEAPAPIDPMIEAVSTAYVVRLQQIAAYIDSGRFPPFMVTELKQKLASIRKEQKAWEQGITGRQAHADRG